MRVRFTYISRTKHSVKVIDNIDSGHKKEGEKSKIFPPLFLRFNYPKTILL